ncbi:MAG: response regulator [Anaerolineales bacterium]|nr:response regulator [Anaerolineales bacterium]
MTGRLRPPGRRLLLVIEDDPDTGSLLRMYFTGLDYDVEVAMRGADGLAIAQRRYPDLVLLDVNLPDINGNEVCVRLRASPRTGYLPVIMLSEKIALTDKVAGLEAGAQDYITKPFDLEELRLRVQNLVTRATRDNQVDPRTRLPTGAWMEDQARQAAARPGWHVLQARLEAFQVFLDQNGFVAGDEVLKFTAHLLRDVCDARGTPEDFLGHAAHDTFLIVTGAADPAALAQETAERFNDEVSAHYSFMDREQGFVLIRGQDGRPTPAPLMTLQVRARD